MAESVWEQRYRNHDCWARLQHAREVLAELELDDAEPAPRQHVARAQRVLRLVDELRGQADPLWVDAEALDELESGANALIQGADQFTSSGNEGHLPQLSVASDRLLQAARRLQVPSPTHATQALSKEVEDARQSRRALESEIAESFQQLESRRDEFDSELKASADELKAQLGEIRGGLETTQGQVEALTNQDREARSSKFEAELASQKEEFEERLGALEEDFAKRMADAQTKADEALQEVARRREEVENEAGAVAVSALGGRLGETADREDGRALGWTITAIVIALLVLPALAWISRTVDANEGTVERAAVAIALVSASGYAARAAGRHRRQAEHYRDRENRMKTLLPFTANLDPEEATALKVLAGLDVFVPNESDEGTTDGPAPRHYLEGRLRELVQRRLGGTAGDDQS